MRCTNESATWSSCGWLSTDKPYTSHLPSSLLVFMYLFFFSWMAVDARGDPLGDRAWPRSGNPWMRLQVPRTWLLEHPVTFVPVPPGPSLLIPVPPTGLARSSAPSEASRLLITPIKAACVCTEVGPLQSSQLPLLPPCSSSGGGKGSDTNWPQGRGGISLGQRTPRDKWASRTPSPPQRREPTS